MMAPCLYRSICQRLEYGVWHGMMQRCFNPACKAYKYYGAKGVSICERWRRSYAWFVIDLDRLIGPRPSPAYSIDRINPFGNYEPGNVRWATAGMQANNKRNSPQWRHLRFPQPIKVVTVHESKRITLTGPVRQMLAIDLRGCGMVFDEIAILFGVTRQRAHQIYLAGIHRYPSFAPTAERRAA